jgi:hypothetical protein
MQFLSGFGDGGAYTASTFSRDCSDYRMTIYGNCRIAFECPFDRRWKPFPGSVLGYWADADIPCMSPKQASNWAAE